MLYIILINKNDVIIRLVKQTHKTKISIKLLFRYIIHGVLAFIVQNTFSFKWSPLNYLSNRSVWRIFFFLPVLLTFQILYRRMLILKSSNVRELSIHVSKAHIAQFKKFYTAIMFWIDSTSSSRYVTNNFDLYSM